MSNCDLCGKNVTPYCEICGSSEVSLEVDSEWDEENQEWVIACIYDDGYCRDCGGIKRRTLEWREI